MKSTRLQTRLALRQRTDGQVVVTNAGFLMAGSNTGELGARQIRRLAQRQRKKSPNEIAPLAGEALSKTQRNTQS